MSIENVVGRLIEIRWGNPLTTQDAALVLQRAAEAPPGENSQIICIDNRAIKLYPADLTHAIEQIIQSTRAWMLRSAVLISKNNAIGSLQQTRIQRTTPGAREKTHTFDEPAALIGWLSEVMTPQERARLEVFLAEAPSRKLSV